MRGDWARVSRITKRTAIVIAAMVLISGAAESLFGAPQAGLAALKRQYWRPGAIPFPKDNPYGRAKEVLGRALFFDPILSGARVRSCATCHNPGLAWGDGEPRAIGGIRFGCRCAGRRYSILPGSPGSDWTDTSTISKASPWARSPAR